MSASSSHRDGRPIVLSFGVLITLCLMVLVTIRTDVLESRPLTLGDRLLPLPNEPILPASGIPVRIGAYIENIYAFSVEHRTFDAVGWLWLSWPDAAEEIFTAQHIRPQHALDFVNQVDGWNFKLDPVRGEAIRLADGRLYQNFRFYGQFYANDLDFHKFPFQTMRLPLVFELTQGRAAGGASALYLMPDINGSGVGGYIDLMGYHTTAFNVTTAIHEYASHFGQDNPATRPRQNRQVAFAVSYQQSVNAALLTLFLPLAVVMALVLLSPMLAASLWDIRLSIPPMALLALIFLQQSYKEKLPVLPYPTYMDLIYDLCYLVNLVLFGLFLWASNRLHLAAEPERPAVIALIDRIDRRFQAGLTLGLGLLSCINWLIIAARY